jgi:uncharacterized protein YciI
VAEWLYFLHAPREDFATTMTDEEQAIFGEHFTHLRRRFDAGKLVLAGPSLGRINTGVSVFEADDEAEARAFIDADPAVASGLCTGELRPFRVSMLRGRD